MSNYFDRLFLYVQNTCIFDLDNFDVSWTSKKTNEWVLNKAGVKRELLDTVKARKLAYYGHTMKKQGRAHWRNLANTIEPSVCGGDADLCQITLTACFYMCRILVSLILTTNFD